MCTDFLPEARRITGQSLRQLCFRQNGINELSNHGVLTGANQVQVFPFNLIHHIFHFGKAHNTIYNIAANHERWDVIGESFVDHEISCICQNGGVQPCNISAQIIEAIAAGLSCSIQINTMQFLHNINMIRNREIGNNRFSKAFYFYIFAVVSADRYRWINEVWNLHHGFPNLAFQLCFQLLLFFQLCANCSNLCLYSFGFFLFALSHEAANLLAERLSLPTQRIALYLGFPVLLIHGNNFIDQRQLFVLELFLQVFFYQLRFSPEPFDINHCMKLLFHCFT